MLAVFGRKTIIPNPKPPRMLPPVLKYLLGKGQVLPCVDHLEIIRDRSNIITTVRVEKFNPSTGEWEARLLALTDEALFILWTRDRANTVGNINIQHEILTFLNINDIMAVDQFSGKDLHGTSDIPLAKVFNSKDFPPRHVNLTGDYFFVTFEVDPFKSKSYIFKYVGHAPELAKRKSNVMALFKRFKSERLSFRESEANGSAFISQLSMWSAEHARRSRIKKKIKRVQAWAKVNVLESALYNLAIFGMIILNFYFTVLDFENTDPDKVSYFERIDLIFTLAFVFELVLNLVIQGRSFFAHGWLIFDLCIVSVSVLLLLVQVSEGNAAARQMRMLRTLRLLRAMTRFKQLQRIVNALVSSIIPTLEAQLVALVVIFIYAVMGMQSFRERDPEDFGSFSRACITLLGVATTLQSWPTDRLPLVIDETQTLDHRVVFYTLSFVIIVMIVIVQMVVAVLIDKFLSESSRDQPAPPDAAAEWDDSDGEDEGEATGKESPLEPFLAAAVRLLASERRLDRFLRRKHDAYTTDLTPAVPEAGPGPRRLWYTQLRHGLFLDYGADLPPDPPPLAPDGNQGGVDAASWAAGLSFEQFRDWARGEVRRYARRRAARMTEDAGLLEAVQALAAEQADMRAIAHDILTAVSRLSPAFSPPTGGCHRSSHCNSCCCCCHHDNGSRANGVGHHDCAVDGKAVGGGGGGVGGCQGQGEGAPSISTVAPEMPQIRRRRPTRNFLRASSSPAAPAGSGAMDDADRPVTAPPQLWRLLDVFSFSSSSSYSRPTPSAEDARPMASSTQSWSVTGRQGFKDSEAVPAPDESDSDMLPAPVGHGQGGHGEGGDSDAVWSPLPRQVSGSPPSQPQSLTTRMAMSSDFVLVSDAVARLFGSVQARPPEQAQRHRLSLPSDAGPNVKVAAD